MTSLSGNPKGHFIYACCSVERIVMIQGLEVSRSSCFSGPQAFVTVKLKFSNQLFLWFWGHLPQWMEWVPTNFPKGGRGLIAISCFSPYNSKPCVNQQSCFMRFFFFCRRQDNLGSQFSINVSQNIIYQICRSGDKLSLLFISFGYYCIFNIFLKGLELQGDGQFGCWVQNPHNRSYDPTYGLV